MIIISFHSTKEGFKVLRVRRRCVIPSWVSIPLRKVSRLEELNDGKEAKAVSIPLRKVSRARDGVLPWMSAPFPFH